VILILLQGFYYFNVSCLSQFLALVWYRKRAESDTSVPDAANKAEIFAERLGGLLLLHSSLFVHFEWYFA
jgi:hypothetical protein